MGGGKEFTLKAKIGGQNQLSEIMKKDVFYALAVAFFIKTGSIHVYPKELEVGYIILFSPYVVFPR